MTNSNWITKDDLESYVLEYGPNSYAAVVYYHKYGFMDIAHCYKEALMLSIDDGKFLLISEFE